MAAEIVLTYWRKGAGKYQAQLWLKAEGRGRGVVAERTFASVDAAKRWGRGKARSRKAKFRSKRW